MTTQQPEALRLANVCSNLTRYSMDAHLIAAELRRLHAHITELESQHFDAADMTTAAAQGFRDGVAAISANAGSEPVANNRPSLEEVFRRLSSRAYCNYIEQIGSDVCLGWIYKARHGMFGQGELNGHIAAGEQLGRHKAFAEAANALRAARAPADSVTAPVGGGVAGMSTIMEKIDTLIASINGAHDAKRPDWKQACFDAADLAYEQIKLMLTATTPPTQTTDSVLEDAARLDFLIEQRAYVVSDPDACPGYWLHFVHKETGKCWVQGDEHPTPRAAIDAARKQGEKQ